MAATRKLPSDRELEKMLDLGLTHQEIADQVSQQIGEPVTRAAVSVAVSRAGLADRRKRYDEMIPWRVKVAHQSSYDLWMLRIAARLDRGVAVTDEERGRFDRWKARLDDEDLVVDYDSKEETGFIYRPRRAGLDGGLIREPARRPELAGEKV